MSRKVSFIIFIALTAVLLFTACERSANQPILATPTAMPTNLTPQPTNLSLVQAWGTKTAQYVGTMVTLGTFTPAATPQANQTPTPQGTPAATSILPATGAPTSTLMPGTTPFPGTTQEIGRAHV